MKKQSREQLYLNRTPTLALLASPSHFLIHLADQLRGERLVCNEWIAELRERDQVILIRYLI